MSNTPSTAEAPEDVSFDLTGLAQVAEKAGVDIGASPENDTAAALADAEKLAQEEFEKKAAAPAEGAVVETDEEKAAKLFAAADAEKAAADKAALEAAGTSDADKAAADAAKAGADAKAAEDAAKKASDDAETVHMRPGQKKAWNAMKSEREAARAEAAAAKAEADAAKARIAELEAAKATTVIPKEIEEERALMRAQIQELAAEKDPEIVRKYDTKIKANNDSVVAILKHFKFDKLIDDKGNVTGENPDAIPSLLAKGISFRTLATQIAALEKGGAVEEAEQIKEAIRENMRLGRDRTAEVQQIKSEVDTRTKARVDQQTAGFQALTTKVIDGANKILAEDLGTLSKKFTFLVKPDAPLATDTPAIAAAKKSAQADFQAGEEAIGKVAMAINSSGKQGDEYVKAEGTKAALAIQSVVLKQRVIPRLEADLAKATARVKELEADVAKFRGAGAISRAHGAAAQTVKGKDNVPAGASLEEGLKSFAASQGVSVNT